VPLKVRELIRRREVHRRSKLAAYRQFLERGTLPEETERFSGDEHLQLKAYGVREPDLDLALSELVRFLKDHALPRIQEICREPIPSRRCRVSQ